MGKPVVGVAVRCNLRDLDADDVPAAQLAVDCEVEHCKVAGELFDGQSRSDCPNVLQSQRGALPRSAYPCSKGCGLAWLAKKLWSLASSYFSVTEEAGGYAVAAAGAGKSPSSRKLHPVANR